MESMFADNYDYAKIMTDYFLGFVMVWTLSLAMVAKHAKSGRLILSSRASHNEISVWNGCKIEIVLRCGVGCIIMN